MFLFIILSFIFLGSIYLSKETFQSKKNILTSQRLNYEDSIMDANLITLPVSGWNYVLDKLENQQPVDLYGNPDELIIDLMDINTYFFTSAKRTALQKGYFCIFTHPKKKDDFKCGFDWTNKRIGYFDRIEQNMIRSILYGYRTHAKLELIELEYLNQLELLFDHLDAIVAYVIPGSIFSKLLASQNLVLLDIKDFDLERTRITYPGLFLENKTIDSIFGVNHKIQINTSTAQLIGTQLYRIMLPKNEISETFITRLIKEDPGDYSCVGDDERLISKRACESPYDVFGEPKTQPTVWDKPCKQNEDCPFYQANKNYPNQRGQCLPTGICELPIGILRMSYTKYNDRGVYTPFCYQCRNPNDPKCCKEQERLVTLQKEDSQTYYTHLQSPDYAFSNDTEERSKNRLPTTIQLS